MVLGGNFQTLGKGVWLSLCENAIKASKKRKQFYSYSYG